MTALQDLKNFDLANAQVNLWTVRGPSGPAAQSPTYSGRWVETTQGVDQALKEAFATDLARIEEVLDYTLLAQNNEASALHIQADETHSAILIAEIAAEIAGKKARTVKHLQNSKFYVAKFITDDQVVYGVRKTDAGWKTKKAASVRNLYFADEQLALDERPHFELSRTFDFFILGDDILILDKGHFETVLRHKAEQRADFIALRAEADFLAVFVALDPLVAYIGDNKIQLRRACAIRSKGHYRDPIFMENLRNNQAEYGFNIMFDEQGRIVATPETCAQIMKALLDHRLKSGFSSLIYDVQDTTPVNV